MTSSHRALDPDAVDAARREVADPSLDPVRRFVESWGVRATDSEAPQVLQDSATGPDEGLVWFQAERCLLHLVVSVERQEGVWRATFAQSDSHARVALRVTSLGSDPDAITATLGIAPSRQARAGLALEQGAAVDRREHLWIRDVLAGSPASVEVKLEVLLRTLELHRSGLASLLAGTGTASVCVAYHGDADSMQGLCLDPALLGRLATLGLPIEIDFYAERPGGPPH